MDFLKLSASRAMKSSASDLLSFAQLINGTDWAADGVKALLGEGRRDESGDFTKGAGLDPAQVDQIMDVFAAPVIEPAFVRTNDATIAEWRKSKFASNKTFSDAVDDLEKITQLTEAAKYTTESIRMDISVVRGLEYYTGPVFEAEITTEVKNEDGQTVRFGSVGGGGRYDGLVERFLGQKVPATGFSIGVSRLQAALAALNKDKPAVSDGPVVVLVMDKGELPRYQQMAQSLRQAGIRAEMYLGTAGMKAQMKYADKRGAPCVVIQGGDERRQGRGADQGPDRRRQGRRHHQGQQGVARGPPRAVLRARRRPRRQGPRSPGPA